MPSGLQDRYYREKLEVDPRDPAAVRRAVEAFVQGLNWVLEYYYRGVVSWAWFYPFHYSPMISDMTSLTGIPSSFERGQPFSPYQQLLAVLPAASSKLLPKPYQVGVLLIILQVHGDSERLLVRERDTCWYMLPRMQMAALYSCAPCRSASRHDSASRAFTAS